MSDPIADMLTTIRNALKVKKDTVSIPYSKIKFQIGKILKREGYISDIKKEDKVLSLELKYTKKIPTIEGLKRISKPGRRIYAKGKELPSVKNNLGIAIISTSSGLMTNKEARKKNLGGEIICEVW